MNTLHAKAIIQIFTWARDCSFAHKSFDTWRRTSSFEMMVIIRRQAVGNPLTCSFCSKQPNTSTQFDKISGCFEDLAAKLGRACMNFLAVFSSGRNCIATRSASSLRLVELGGHFKFFVLSQCSNCSNRAVNTFLRHGNILT